MEGCLLWNWIQFRELGSKDDDLIKDVLFYHVLLYCMDASQITLFIISMNHQPEIEDRSW